MRSIVIGDIHGSYPSLVDVLSKVDFNLQNDRLIFLGDYVDTWPESFEVVDHLLDIKEKAVHKPIFILGNHDFWFTQILEHGMSFFRNEKEVRSLNPIWYENGGEETYKSYLHQPDRSIIRHYEEFYTKLLYSYEEDQKLYIHAGFNINKGYDWTLENSKKDFLWNRDLHYRWAEMKNSKGSKEQVDRFTKIYYGHTPTLNEGLDIPIQFGNLLNLDQGCKITGKLTAWIEDEETFFRSNGRKKD